MEAPGLSSYYQKIPQYPNLIEWSLSGALATSGAIGADPIPQTLNSLVVWRSMYKTDQDLDFVVTFLGFINRGIIVYRKDRMNECCESLVSS